MASHSHRYRSEGQNGHENQKEQSRDTRQRTNNNVPSPITAFTLLHQSRQQAAVSPRLSLLRDSTEPWLTLQSTGIHELAGEAGTGKTQIALSLCLTAATQANTDSSSSCRAMYISLKHGNLPKVLQRLQQMADANNKENRDNSQRFLQCILTRAVSNQEDLFQLLTDELPTLIQQNKNTMRILVLDSIADLFRGIQDDDDNNDQTLNARRSASLFRLTARLRQLSDQYQFPILVLNQVTKTCTLPALGLSWAHCVNTTYLLTRIEQIQQQQQTTTTFRRRIRLQKSPCLPSGQVTSFRIDPAGVYQE